LATNQFFTDPAGHARTHPEAALLRWWPAARCQRIGAFAEDGDDTVVYAYTARVRPDGHGIWREHNATVPYFLEVDLATEPLWAFQLCIIRIRIPR
jgi:Replication-relaxation